MATRSPCGASSTPAAVPTLRPGALRAGRGPLRGTSPVPSGTSGGPCGEAWHPLSSDRTSLWWLRPALSSPHAGAGLSPWYVPHTHQGGGHLRSGVRRGQWASSSLSRPSGQQALAHPGCSRSFCHSRLSPACLAAQAGSSVCLGDEADARPSGQVLGPQLPLVLQSGKSSRSHPGGHPGPAY